MSEENTPPVVQPEFEAVTEVCPPGANPAPAPAKAKRAKAVAKLYYITDGLTPGDDQYLPHFTVQPGSDKGFRTKEEMVKFVKTLPPGNYTPITVALKPITVTETKKVSIKGL
jgi:hypothetical protein